MIENNRVALSGEIVTNFEFSHEVCGEGFYTALLASERLSGKKDILPIMVSNRLVDVKAEWTGRFANISGQFRSYNKHEKDKSRLILSVFAKDFNETGEIPFLNNVNSISLEGYICKCPNCRETPLGREVADILLAVNRPYRKTDYIPTICWGRNARFSEKLQVGTKLQIEGRIQSREYLKKISENEAEKRIAYEVSVQKMEAAEDEQSED